MKKRLCISVITVLYFQSYGQKLNWQNMDLKTDSFFGISTEKAYHEILNKMKPSPVIVAVIDSGIDTAQEDLKQLMWTNPEDGSHGRNYMGFETGKEDITNLASFRKDFYDSLSYTNVPETYRNGYQIFRKTSKEYEGHVKAMEAFVYKLKAAKATLDNMLVIIGKNNPLQEDFNKYQPQNDDEKFLKKMILKKLPHYPDFLHLRKRELYDLLMLAEYHLTHGLNINITDALPGEVKQNNVMDVNNDALGLIPDENFTPYHGTHVSGIIAATRGNGIGMDGVADHVQIMMFKTLNNVRELRDENLANAIRFAADHGAKIINLSFGKPYSWDKKAVDEAVRYAMQKDILIIHAAGNAGNDLDKVEHYPNPIYQDGKGMAKAWIEVGASGWADDSTLIPSFSNYGKTTVDVFAPGVQIYSTLPFNQYAYFDGTSMAAPVVSGMAALIREYFPKLTAPQVKEIIMQTVEKVNHPVYVKNNNGESRAMPFSDICVSGGIVNAYKALLLASRYK